MVAIEQWSFTDDERAETDRAGLAADDAAFDEALGEVWRAQEEILALDLKAQMAAQAEAKAGANAEARAGAKAAPRGRHPKDNA
jgi:hypothetical protein